MSEVRKSVSEVIAENKARYNAAFYAVVKAFREAQGEEGE